MKRVIFAVFFVTVSIAATFAQETNHVINPRIRVIVDHDFGGDPDGLLMLAHLLLSPSVETRGIIASQHYKDFYRNPGTVDYSMQMLQELLDTLSVSKRNYPCSTGLPSNLADTLAGVDSEAANMIIEEALRTDTKAPLYVLCGAGLTNIANALLLHPEIASFLTLVWISGPEYPDLASAMVLPQKEYNLGIDPLAAQYVFNNTDVHIWQVPRDAYRQCLMSYSEMMSRVKTTGPVGEYLVDRLTDLMKKTKGNLGEAYALGDSPLVLLTALQCSWDKDATSCATTIVPRPAIDDEGRYRKGKSDAKKIRVFTRIDNRLMFEDMITKFILANSRKGEARSPELSNP